MGNYDSAREGLELLRAQGVSPDFEIASALINSASALTGLERRAEARDRLLRAKVQAAKLPNDDPRAQFLVDAASKFLDRLDAVALPEELELLGVYLRLDLLRNHDFGGNGERMHNIPVTHLPPEVFQ